MPDLEKVIKGLECHQIDKDHRINCSDCPYHCDEFMNGLNELHNDAILLLKEQEGHWIPVTERLPEDDTDILVYCVDGEESRIVAVNYANGVWFDCIFNTVMVVKNITHWMPLPKPPQEGR